jgi:hypothetical protein
MFRSASTRSCARRCRRPPHRSWNDQFRHPVRPRRVDIGYTAGGWSRVTLTSPPPAHERLADVQLDALLECCGWTRDLLDRRLAPVVACAGARHAVVPILDCHILAAYDRLRGLCVQHEWVTFHLMAKTRLASHARGNVRQVWARSQQTCQPSR